MSTELQALERAIELLGGQAALGKAVGKSQAHVWSWLHRSKRVPADMAIRVETATNGQVLRQELRPDLYPYQGEAA